MRPGSSRSRRPGRSAVRRDDDTDLDYYDTLAGKFWRLDAEPGQAIHSDEPGQPGRSPAITHNNTP